MALNASFNKAKVEIAEAASRNLQHSRPQPNGTSRPTSTKPSDAKRSHETAFAPPPRSTAAGHAGGELYTNVVTAIKYLKEKEMRLVTFEDLVGYLSLPNDLRANIPRIKKALQANERVHFVPRSESGNGKDCFKYRPLLPVSNGEELKDYLARPDTAMGVAIKELKDGWPDCVPVIEQMEGEGSVLVTRLKDNTPRIVWSDNPDYHILEPKTHLPQKADQDFVDFWLKTKLPASEMELRMELEKAGLTPTSQVKEIRRADVKKEKRRVNRKGGKTTNSHMMGILKDYSNTKR